MGLINYKDIDFNKSINKENKIINFNGSEIQVVNYLSSQDKYDLIMVTLQKSKENNVYNPYLIDLYFKLNIVYLYTNIVFTAEDRADEGGLYDTLKRSGLIDAVISVIDKNELLELQKYIDEIINFNHNYFNSIGFVVSDFTNQVGPIISKIGSLVKAIDLEKVNSAMTMLNNKLSQGVAEE